MTGSKTNSVEDSVLVSVCDRVRPLQQLAFTVNGSDKVCGRICFYKTQAFKKSVMESVLVKLQAITMNGNARVCGRFCYRLCF